MVEIRIRAFRLDEMPKCEHGRALCTACGFDPFTGAAGENALSNSCNPLSQHLSNGARAKDSRARFVSFHEVLDI